MSSKYTRGSKWRKWDLHFHTPSSFDYRNMSVTNELIIETLVSAGIEVVAVTDHHIIDVNRIKELQRIGKDRVTVLPGIEFRSELGGSESVHFIGIFAENSDIDSIWIKLQSSCKLTPEDLKTKKNEEISCDFIETAKLIHENNGIVSVHAGSKSNSIEAITNALSHKMATKRELVNHIDIYELGKLVDSEDYERIVFPAIGKILPMIICSDNHNIKKYQIKENLWIKADPTFEGLKQIIHEPQQRVYIGETPYKLEFLDNHKELFIDLISITSSSNDQEWFDSVNTIKLNNGLVTIIGNKGNGKSALADIIGMTSNANTSEYSFLNKGKFLMHTSHTKYKSLVKFIDGIEYEKDFTKPEHNKTLPSKVVYLSQSFVRELCEDLETSRLQNEIDRVIFSHIPAEEQLDKNNLKDLLTLKNKNIESNVLSEKAKLHRANMDIEDIEKQLKKDYLEKIKNKLNEKEKSYDLLEKSKPKTILKPEKISTENSKNISIIKGKIKEIKAKTSRKQLDLNAIVQDRQALENLMDRLNTLKLDINETIIDMKENETFKKHKLNVDEILKLEIKIDPIDQILKTLKKQITDYKKEIKNDEEILKQLDDELKKINKTLDDKQKQFQLYIENIEQIEKKKLEIQGDKNTKDTIIYYRKIISDITNELPLKLAELNKKRDEMGVQRILCK